MTPDRERPRANMQVSSFLAAADLSYFTNHLGEHGRFWQVPFILEEIELSIILYVAGSTFGVGLEVQCLSGNWRDDVWQLLEPKIPFIRVIPSRDEQDVENAGRFWIRVDIPMDMTFDLPVLYGTIHQAVVAVQNASLMLFKAFPGRFKSLRSTWISVGVTSFSPTT